MEECDLSTSMAAELPQDIPHPIITSDISIPHARPSPPQMDLSAYTSPPNLIVSFMLVMKWLFSCWRKLNAFAYLLKHDSTQACSSFPRACPTLKFTHRFAQKRCCLVIEVLFYQCSWSFLSVPKRTGEGISTVPMALKGSILNSFPGCLISNSDIFIIIFSIDSL